MQSDRDRLLEKIVAMRTPLNGIILVKVNVTNGQAIA